jgi:hypothetical protein
MTLNGVSFDKPCAGDPDEARDRAAGYLVQLGYALVERNAQRVHLKFSGRWFTTDPEEQTHHAYVSAVPGSLHFEFTTGIVASYWTDADRSMADDRAERAARAARAAGDYRGSPGDVPLPACAYCGKKNPEGASCSVCGARPR